MNLTANWANPKDSVGDVLRGYEAKYLMRMAVSLAFAPSAAECPRKEALRRTRGRIFSPHTRELTHRGESFFANYRYTRLDFYTRISPTTEGLANHHFQRVKRRPPT